MTTPLSVVILTKNEEQFIARCISSVAWADEVLVLDSGSTDSTQEIAWSMGARVHEQHWLGWSGQRNCAISLAKNDWVFCLEADEIVTTELAQSIMDAMAVPMNENDGYYLVRKGDFLGVLLRSTSRPAKIRRFVRLFNRRYSAYDPAMRVHEEVKISGQSHYLSGVLLHWRGYTLGEYIPVFDRYATLEAEILHENGCSPQTLTILMRPVLRFLWLYVYHQEFRHGARGLIHAMLKATSEFIRYAKLWEMQNAPQIIHPPAGVYQETSNKRCRDNQKSSEGLISEIKIDHDC